MTILRHILAWFVGEGWCPACDGRLREHEAGYHICRKCCAVVDYSRGGWHYHGEHQLRRLPGVAGISFDEDAAA